MGNIVTLQHTFTSDLIKQDPDSVPKSFSKPTFDPQEGFDYERKKRAVKYTEAEMEALRIPPSKRDYCAHLLIPYHKCRQDHFPFFYYCSHEKHEYLNCKMDIQEDQIKEWERERRLRLR